MLNIWCRIEITWCMCAYLPSHVQLFVTSSTVAHQAPLSMGFSRQEYWSGSLFPSPEDLPDPGIKCGSPALQAYSLPLVPPIFHKSRENIPMLFWSQEIYLPLCMYVCINLSIHPVFLEKFWIHSKIEQKIQRSCVYLAPIYAQLSPWSTSHTGLVHLLSLMNLTDTTIIIQSLSFTLGFTLGVVYSMDFDKCVMIRIHHCNSRWMLMF